MNYKISTANPFLTCGPINFIIFTSLSIFRRFLVTVFTFILFCIVLRVRKQCRLWSDASLNWVCIVCLCPQTDFQSRKCEIPSSSVIRVYSLISQLHWLHCLFVGWSGGAVVLGKPPVPGRPTNLDNSRTKAYCACSRCGGGCLDVFSLVYHFFSFSPSLGVGPI